MANPRSKTLALVISAIKNLRELKGSTSREILRYLSSVYDIPSNVARRQMQTVLKRGVAYGILKKNGGHYILPTASETKCQEIAAEEVDLLDAQLKRGRHRRRGRRNLCGRKRRSRRRSCKCKRTRSRMRRSRRRRGCKPRRLRRRKCNCGGLGNKREQQRRIKRYGTASEFEGEGRKPLDSTAGADDLAQSSSATTVSSVES